jgi:hypothetical protein
MSVAVSAPIVSFATLSAFSVAEICRFLKVSVTVSAQVGVQRREEGAFYT